MKEFPFAPSWTTSLRPFRQYITSQCSPQKEEGGSRKLFNGNLLSREKTLHNCASASCVCIRDNYLSLFDHQKSAIEWACYWSDISNVGLKLTSKYPNKVLMAHYLQLPVYIIIIIRTSCETGPDDWLAWLLFSTAGFKSTPSSAHTTDNFPFKCKQL